MQKVYLADNAYEIIRERILRCEYAPGSQINEEQLVADLGISRTPIHSALVRMEQEHLLKIVSKKGIYITDISYEQIHDVYEYRSLMEPYALRSYGNRFSKQTLQDFARQFRMPQNDVWTFFQQDNLFHMQIIDLCGNHLISAYYQSIQSLNMRISPYSSRLENRISVSNEEHPSIINALLKDNYTLAAELITEHLNTAKQAAYSILENNCLGQVPAVEAETLA